MRLHPSAWVALVSVATYAACGSSDDIRKDQEAGAGGQDGGEAGSTGGGSKSSAGSSNPAGNSGQAGSSAGNGGEGGTTMDGSSGEGGRAGEGGDVSAAGAAGSATDMRLPAACPGVIADYTIVTGSEDADTFSTAQQTGQTLILGLAGDDVIDRNHDGNDCLVGGPGNDDISNPSEAMSFMIGGAGADKFRLSSQLNNYAQIVDMSAEDSIGLSKATFAFLGGTTGAPLLDTQIYSVVDYAAGTGSVPANEGAAIVYDPATGGIYQDLDRGTKESGSTQIATIVNHASYTYDISDFVLDD